MDLSRINARTLAQLANMQSGRSVPSAPTRTSMVAGHALDLGESGAPSWPHPITIPFSGTGTWTMPASDWMDVRGHIFAYVLVYIDFVSGSGPIVVKLQGCVTPYQGSDSTAWVDLDTTSSISSASTQVLKVTRLSTNMLTGYLRVVVTASGGATVTIRGEALLKQPVPFAAAEWQPSTYLSFASSGTWIQPMPRWLDCSGYLSQYAFIDFSGGTSGTNLTVYLETAVQPTADSNQWATVASSALASTSGVVLLDGRSSASTPPYGVTRLKVVASAAASGTIRCLNLLKDT